MPFDEKLKKVIVEMIPEIMDEFERGFNEIIGHLSLMWNFPVPSINEIKQRNYNLYDEIWSNCWIIGITKKHGLDILTLNKYKNRIRKINDIKNR